MNFYAALDIFLFSEMPVNVYSKSTLNLSPLNLDWLLLKIEALFMAEHMESCFLLVDH